MERDTGFIEEPMEKKDIPIHPHRQLAPELQVVGFVEGILDLNDNRSKSGESCIVQEKPKMFHRRNFLRAGTKPQNALWERFNGKTEDIPSLPVPRNLNDRMKNPILKFLRTKIDPHFLEQASLKMVVGWMAATCACIMIDMDISLLNFLWWHNESNALFYGLKWNTRLIDTFTLREIYLFSVSSVVFLGIAPATLMHFWNHLNIGKHSKIVMDYSRGAIHYHVQRNLLELQKRGYIGIRQDITRTLPELIDELYASWKIYEFDTIVFDSYLLREGKILEEMRSMIQRLVPFGKITDLPKRPLNKNISYLLELQEIQKEWFVSLNKRDNPVKKTLAPLLCSDRLSSLSLVWAAMYHMYRNSEFLRFMTPSFISKKGNVWNEKFTHTYGLKLEIPRERPQ